VINHWQRLLLITLLTLLSSCTAMKIEQFNDQKPTLVLEEYFQGRVLAWGIFQDRFGNLRRQFQVEIDGHWDGSTLVLDEHFRYSDGERDRRVWTISALGDGRYQGKADDIIGEAEGIARGNALNWRYEMELPVGERKWRVRFDDWMFLQADGVLVNRATVSKWGLKIGEVTLFFIRQDQLRQGPDKQTFPLTNE